jgi:hypothetical protein
MNPYKEKLSNGQIYKSYKELCCFLDERIKTGNAKKSQVADWERYFLWKMESYKFIIEDVFDKPKGKTVQHGGQRDIIPSVPNIKRLLLDLLASANDNQVYISKYDLYNELYMTNEKYGVYLLKRATLRKITGIGDGDISEFYESSYGMLKSSLDRAIRDLERDDIISAKVVYFVIYYDDNQFNERLATDGDIDIILMSEDQARKDMGIIKVSTIMSLNRWDEYKVIVNKFLKKNKANFRYYNKKYDLELISEEIKLDILKLNSSDKKSEQAAVNSKTIEHYLKYTSIRQLKAFNDEGNRGGFGKNPDKKVRRRIDPKFMSVQKKLGRYLLKTESSLAN